MCLIAFAIQPFPGLELVIASNRDERWDRPTLPLQAWALPSGKQAYSGRDLQAGGTWLGLAQDGRVAMLTNVRDGQPDAAPRSRGELVTRWLDAAADWEDWLPRFDPQQYGGFNLVLGDLARGRWAWVSNRKPDDHGQDMDEAGGEALPPGWHGRSLGPGLYGVSNAALDTPWPKTVALKRALRRHIDDGAAAHAAQGLLDALLHCLPADPAELPSTGVAPQIERALSSAFVHAPEMRYGTRSSMIVHWHAGGHLDAREWTHLPESHDFAVDRSPFWPLAGSRLAQLASGLSLAGTQHPDRL
jgi:uncharacterized protein with NRDE domain